MKAIKILTASLLFFTVRVSFAQWSLGGTLGVSNYVGDIAPKTSAFSFEMHSTRYSLGFNVSKKFTPRLSGRADLSYIRIMGSDFESADPNDAESRGRYIRNLHFRNDILELSLKCVFDLIPSTDNSKIVPYLMAGVSGFYHNPKAKGYDPDKNYDLRWIALQPLQTEGIKYSKLQFSIPVGIGVKYNITSSFSLGVELLYRNTFTDYLDDISADRYADLSGKSYLTRYFANRTASGYDLVSESERPLAPGTNVVTYQYQDGTKYAAIGGYHAGEGGERRGDPSKKDQFFTGGITLSWVLGSEGEARYR